MVPDRHEAASWITRVELAIAAALQFAIALIVLQSMRSGQWLIAFSGSVVFFLTFLPAIIERQLRVSLPVEFSLTVCVFLYACFALGDVSRFYERFWWWDLMLHGISAFVLGLIGFLMIYVFYMTHRVQVAPMYVAAITFALAVTVGTLWEIFEFLSDWTIGTQMQQSGLVDTMTDLMINSAGALLAAGIGYCYVHGGDSLLARRFIGALMRRRLDGPSSRPDSRAA